MEIQGVSKNICEVIGTGSSGNAVLYHRQILIDIGLPYKRIEPFKKEIQLVALTHFHKSDHLNLSALKKLQFERPTLRICCADFMLEHLQGFKNIDIMEIGKVYDYGAFKISNFKLYHDILNVGYRIFKDDHKTFHATDTFTLEGLTAKDYDLLAIEHNYNEETIFKSIENIEKNGGFAYQTGAINSHLSEEQARDFIFKNRKESTQVVRLHESARS